METLELFSHKERTSLFMNKENFYEQWMKSENLDICYSLRVQI